MDEATISAYVATAAALLDMPLDDDRHAAVTVVMLRLAAFASDVAAAAHPE